MFKREFKDNNVTITITSKESLTKDQMKQALLKLANSKTLDSRIYKCWVCDSSGYIKPQEGTVKYEKDCMGNLMAIVCTDIWNIHIYAKGFESAISSPNPLDVYSRNLFIADSKENLKAKVENHYISKVSKIFDNNEVK